MAGCRFAPKPGEKISFFQETFTVQAHPQVPYMVYAAAGRRATVYKLVAARQTLALKVFKPSFQDPALEENALQIRHFLDLEGLKAADRRVVLPSEEAAKDCRDLAYALLMPWLRGTTFYDLLLGASKSAPFQIPAAIHACERFLRVMRGLERRGIAHTDIAPGNVMIDPKNLSVELLDLEDLYAPGLPPPQHRHGGSAGYRHSGNGGGPGVWCGEGDRYAAAIMAAEMLVLAETGLAALATDEGFFLGHHRTQLGQERYNRAQPWLHALAPGFLDVFRRAWSAERIQDCPSLADLHGAIAEVAVRTPLTPGGLFVDDPKVPGKQTQPKEIPVAWEPIEVVWEPPSPTPGSAAAQGSTAGGVPSKRKKKDDPLGMSVGIALLAGTIISISTGQPIWILVLLGFGFIFGLLLRE